MKKEAKEEEELRKSLLKKRGVLNTCRRLLKHHSDFFPTPTPLAFVSYSEGLLERHSSQMAMEEEEHSECKGGDKGSTCAESCTTAMVATSKGKPFPPAAFQLDQRGVQKAPGHFT